MGEEQRVPTRTIALLGPTASGKSALGMLLARRWGGEIVSVDSAQVYRGMDIGTAKPSGDEQAQVAHHMIDVADPSEEYAVASYQADGRAAMADITDRGLLTILVGGSGLYFRSLVDPMQFFPTDRGTREAIDLMPHAEAVAELLEADPWAGGHVDLDNPRRVSRALEVFRLGGGTPTERSQDPRVQQVRQYQPERPFVAFALDPGDRLVSRAGDRIDQMLEAGLVDEVAGLAGRMSRTASAAVGYRQFLPVVGGERSVEEGRAATLRATLMLARKQRTYFGRDPRITWLPWDSDPETCYRSVESALQGARW